MSETAHIYRNRQPRRPHFIQEWAERRGLRQVDLAEDLGVDKSLVSRWYSGSTPSSSWQIRIAALFGCETESLFRHPDDDWFVRFFEDRSREEIEKIKKTLEAAFPKENDAA